MLDSLKRREDLSAYLSTHSSIAAGKKVVVDLSGIDDQYSKRAATIVAALLFCHEQDALRRLVVSVNARSSSFVTHMVAIRDQILLAREKGEIAWEPVQTMLKTRSEHEEKHIRSLEKILGQKIVSERLDLDWSRD